MRMTPSSAISRGFVFAFALGVMLAAVSATPRHCLAQKLEIVAIDEAPKDKEPAASQPSELDIYVEALKDIKLTPDKDTLAKYLKHLHPTPEQAKRVKELIAAMGSDDWRVREDATKELMALPILPVQTLRELSKHEDLEVRNRAADILAKCEGQLPNNMHAVFKVLGAKKYPGMAELVLQAIPLCEMEYVHQAAREALCGVATPADADLLRKSLKSEKPELRMAAAMALAAALKDKALGDVTPIMEDKVAGVRLMAAVACVSLGERKALNVLVDLLADKDIEVRYTAEDALRQLADKDLSAEVGDDAEKVQAVWKQWPAGDGQTAKLKPIDELAGDRSYLRGNILVADGYRNTVVELTAAGKEIWSYKGAVGAWSAEKLRNGNVLIASYQGNKAIEVNAKGEIVWEYATNCLNAKQLPNGNYLLCNYSGNTVIEVNRDKKEVWIWKAPNNSSCAQRLRNGNTLVATHTGVFEVTRDGKTVWEYRGGAFYSAQRLRNGNTLIADMNGGKVIEVTPDKKVVWELQENSVNDAYRLPNGNTLITGGNRHIEVTPDKRVIWTRDGASFGTARK